MELVVMGPGSIQQAHKTDEWIAKDQLHKGVDVFARMVSRLCIGGGYGLVHQPAYDTQGQIAINGNWNFAKKSPENGKWGRRGLLP